MELRCTWLHLQGAFDINPITCEWEDAGQCFSISGSTKGLIYAQ